MLAALAVATALVPDHRIELRIHSDPEGAEILVIPQGFNAHQCTAPCTVRIPQEMGFTVYAVRSGYRQVGAADVHWVRKGWNSADLSAHEVTIRLTPKPETDVP